MPTAVRPSAVTMLYATAEIAAAYRRMDRRGLEEWREQASRPGRRFATCASAICCPLACHRPLRTGGTTRAGLISAVTFLATALGRDMPRPTRSTAT
jgi:hypothetical protein